MKLPKQDVSHPAASRASLYEADVLLFMKRARAVLWIKVASLTLRNVNVSSTVGAATRHEFVTNYVPTVLDGYGRY